MVSEKIELLGKGLYKDIPDTLTLKSIPTASELDYVGSEDFERTMIDKILPASVEENINFNNLLEIDYFWVCRCLRILNYGPYYTTNSIYCDECGEISYGDFDVNLNTIDCKTLPDGFVNDIVISKDDFIDFDGDIHLKLLTIGRVLDSYNDTAFKNKKGVSNQEFARLCYGITAIKNEKNLNPIDIKFKLQNNLSAADYVILKKKYRELIGYGLRAGGVAQCPKCGNMNAAFIALADDKFFRPTLGNLRRWKSDLHRGKDENLSGDTTAII